MSIESIETQQWAASREAVREVMTDLPENLEEVGKDFVGGAEKVAGALGVFVVAAKSLEIMTRGARESISS